MKILMLLPELDEGGVERHVIMLSDAMQQAGHSVDIASWGGKLEKQLPRGIQHYKVRVHSKNLLTLYWTAREISRLVRKNGYDVIHAHARAPAWAAMWVSRATKTPLVVSAHCSYGNKSKWIYKPHRSASAVICVSESVRQDMTTCFSDNAIVIRNGLPPAPSWETPIKAEATKLLFIGRLASVKGLQDALHALAQVRSEKLWTLDVVGDGPMEQDLKNLTKELGLKDKVHFHGFRDDTDQWMLNSDCLLFPSYREGLSLTLARAIQMGMPVLASNIPSVKELSAGEAYYPEPGDIPAWSTALTSLVEGQMPQSDFIPKKIPTVTQMAANTLGVYAGVLNRSDAKANGELS
ncbi:Glycosyltransferase involved in cell wall bisynthesis [Ectothiorhodosinus mongolicus]|uniref:Glycosyltransferase involved in cell wall bisynthesis n=1 Tax=Ectothiorhodosinus mongolicus TaxID=233100 RepID=A0A1R3VQL6_9GAMM|nr:glycosyltransferase [Ectothiorhodosinus mongolicus]ULX56732.1 glycosyltransferase [Ectothiorhodosinus mongolicus]SIT67039.1 Glycosyltransferase involved in cell wall bisynthesis [Ectothiorhodosinus mongolicus]